MACTLTFHSILSNVPVLPPQDLQPFSLQRRRLPLRGQDQDWGDTGTELHSGSQRLREKKRKKTPGDGLTLPPSSISSVLQHAAPWSLFVHRKEKEKERFLV